MRNCIRYLSGIEYETQSGIESETDSRTPKKLYGYQKRNSNLELNAKLNLELNVELKLRSNLASILNLKLNLKLALNFCVWWLLFTVSKLQIAVYSF